MARFRFNLEKILKMRERIEKDWEIRLAEITSQCTRVQQRILDNQQFAADSLKDRAMGGMTFENLSYSELYMQRMREENVRFAAELRALEKKRLEVQQKYLEASRDRKAIQKIKDKKEKEFKDLQAKKEELAVDDINNSAKARNYLGGW